MKKIILAIALITGLSPVVFAEDDSVNAHLNNTIHLFFKITDSNSLINANKYQQTTFVYKGMPVTMFKNKTSNWCGFFKNILPENLPANVVALIKRKYGNCEIKNATLYFNNEADLIYFAEIIVNTKCLVLKIKPSGRMKVFC